MFIDRDDLFYAQLNGSSHMNPVIKTLITGFVRLHRMGKSEHVFAAMFRGAARLSPVPMSVEIMKMMVKKEDFQGPNCDPCQTMSETIHFYVLS